MPDLIHWSIPAFILLMVIESLATAWRRNDETKGYAARDTAASLTMGIGNVGISFVTKGVRFAFFYWLYEYRVFDLGTGVAVFIAALVAEDFLYYWNHRAGHEIRFFWAAHVTHHSSEHYNLSTALRQTWTGSLNHFIFYWPLPLLGFDPMLLLSVSSINLLYQFWIHTELIDRLPRWFEWAFNTPSHHRVHHGTNVEYLDRNHAGIFMIWDRMFGTFEPERAPVRFGLTKNLESFDPITIAFHEWVAMFRDVRRATCWRDRLGYVFGPPGWSPDGSRQTARDMRAALGAGAQAA